MSVSVIKRVSIANASSICGLYVTRQTLPHTRKSKLILLRETIIRCMVLPISKREIKWVKHLFVVLELRASWDTVSFIAVYPGNQSNNQALGVDQGQTRG